ncbi:MAG TPA: TrkA family potassium uptake protein [Thermoleophilia bacterium]|jgi:trk system potassium uptake protein TrkA|nr:TrkA family potassium uptake protein [Acidobacteriota bacterium]NLT93193.1 TrkA family potassium uptake protein [Actinomycetota bacterium]HOU29313.1 TrkA family potassium uptake protein [Thermoleophilia bacterium]HQF52023.1 TrkA family potassium uptake protein [Thermoleophilia bacterium]HQH20934.1 TrkA family potassium uptake protein [Thermoleophilia bacterium]
MYVIIAGCGRVGSRMARRLSDERHDVVVIDEDAGSFRLLGERFKGHRVVGSAIDWDVLMEAGIEGADAVAATTRGDNTNLICALIAARAFEVPCSVARVYDPHRAAAFAALGVRTVCPTEDASRSMLDAVLACPAAEEE